jgi:hypothetical protein
MIDENRQGLDPRQRRKFLEMTRVATSPCRRQKRCAMLNACCCSQSRFDAFADNKASSDRLVRRQPNEASFGGPKCLPAVDLLASGANRPAMDRARFACYCIGPQRNEAAASRTTFAPGTARMPSKRLTDAVRQSMERDTAVGEIGRCWRSK